MNCDPTARASPRRSIPIWALLILWHLAVALVCHIFLDIRMSLPWDDLWQALPAELLRARLPESILYLHAQPPLFNLYGAFFIRLFPDHAMDALHVGNTLLGALIAPMMYSILKAVTGATRLAFLVALAYATNPALIVFEAYPLYSILTAFLVVAAIWCLTVERGAPGPRRLLGFILALNLIILARSAYHIVLLIPALLLVHRWGHRKDLVVKSAALCVPAVLWYAKNLLLFGFFGSTSWLGLNLWHAASMNYSREERGAWQQAGVVDSTMGAILRDERRSAFRRLSVFGKYGFSRTSRVAALSENDFNNINVVEISRLYRRNALSLIRHDPFHYIGNVVRAYGLYSGPTSRATHLRANAERLGIYDRLYHDYLQGAWLARQVGERLGRFPLGSAWFLLLPAGLAAYAFLAWRGRASPRDPTRRSTGDAPAMPVAAGIISYSAVVGCLFEYGENARFRFDVEALMWLLLAATVNRLATRRPMEKASALARRLD